jgi:hypothetical protein
MDETGLSAVKVVLGKGSAMFTMSRGQHKERRACGQCGALQRRGSVFIMCTKVIRRTAPRNKF